MINSIEGWQTGERGDTRGHRHSEIDSRVNQRSSLRSLAQFTVVDFSQYRQLHFPVVVRSFRGRLAKTKT